MSFKRSGMDEENIGDNDNDVEPSQKRQRFDDSRGRGGRGRGRGGRDRGGRDRGGRGFRGRGGFNRFDNDGDEESGGGRGRGGFNNRGRGGFNNRGRGGFNNRGRGRGDGGGRGFRGGGRGRGWGDGSRGRGRGGGPGGSNSYPQKKCAIKIGQDAPDFNNILNQKSESISLKQFRGKYVVLFIYFQDGKYGSKVEQENFRDLQDKFEKANAVILGVSRDDTTSHSNAASEGKLNYSLLADTKSEITRAYDAIENERVYNSTFIISPEGKIVAVWPQIFGPDQHPQQVFDKLTKIINGETDENEETKQEADNEEDDEREAVDENGDNDEEADDNEEAGDENDNDDQENEDENGDGDDNDEENDDDDEDE